MSQANDTLSAPPGMTKPLSGTGLSAKGGCGPQKMLRAKQPAAGNQRAASSHSPTVVEFTGITGAGKTTLVAAIKEVLTGQGYRVCEAPEAILGCWGLAGVRRYRLRALLVYLLALPRFLRYAATPQGARLASLAARVIVRDAGSMAIAARLAANFARRIGIHFLLRELPPGRDGWDFILFDEGPVHTAHNLFVHAATAPRVAEVALFSRIVPTADLLVWVRVSQDQSVETTLRRGHRRVNGPPAATRAFVNHAWEVFSQIGSADSLQERLLIVDNPADGQSIRQRAEAISGRLLARHAACRGLMADRELFGGLA